MKMKNLLRNFVLITLLLAAFSVSAQIPPRPNPPRLVNDFSQILSAEEVNQLEVKLRRYNDTTSTQIVIVTVNDLGNYEVADFAYRVGQEWGVGQKGKNNGAVIVVKPKQGNSKGRAFIAPGYGLEGAIPDALAKRIVEVEMIPQFKENNYYGGLDAATTAMIKLASGEYKADRYQGGEKPAPYIIIFIIIVIVIILMKSSSGNSNHFGGGRNSSLPFWMAMMLASQAGRSHSGSWGGFSGGSGGGGGGFGGFGGGGFGGGGAGGSW
jgi:uncharacterized protein